MSLTDLKVRQAKPTDKTQKLADGGALYLVIKPNGTKFWWYRYKLDGKENTYSIGEYPAVSLQDARKDRDAARELVKKGMHPGHHRQAERLKQLHSNANSLEAVAKEWLGKKDGHSTEKYIDQIQRSFEMNVYPYVGRMPIRDVTAAHLLPILQRMEERGALTLAIQTRQWLSSLFKFAVVTMRADGDPAAALSGLIKRLPVNHAKPMDEVGIREFWQRLARFKGNRQTAIALELLLYLFVRTGELRLSEWSELDMDSAMWELPPGRMKRRRTHLVPLSRQAVELFREMHQINGGRTYVFQSTRKPNDVMSATTINRALEYLGYAPGTVTAHDFRATASTRLHEMGYRPDIIELQLAHVEKSKTKAAYNHAVYLQERKKMMQEWANYVDTLRS